MKKYSLFFFLIGLVILAQPHMTLADGSGSSGQAEAAAKEPGAAAEEPGAAAEEPGAAAEESGAAAEEPGAMAEEALPQPDPSIEGQWIGSESDWQYQLLDGTFLEKSWLYDGGHWYYLDSDGWLVTGLQKIRSKYYFFRDDGAMATGWIYDEEEDAWYYGEESGELKSGWHQAGGAWYWFHSRGKMFSGGNRMIDAHKYYFFENGQMAGNQYVGLNYYDENGQRDRRYDITIQGNRKPDAEEKERITRSMAEIPREWLKQFHESGWELMFYTDKKYYSAPMTEQGIYYIYYQTDTHYKKVKFTQPEQLPMAIGEYVAWATGNDGEANDFMADYNQYLSLSSEAQGLPSYFDDDSAMQFGNYFANYCDPDIRADMQRNSPALLDRMEAILGIDRSGRRPEEADYLEMTEEERLNSGGNGPANDEMKSNGEPGPASAG